MRFVRAWTVVADVVNPEGEVSHHAGEMVHLSESETPFPDDMVLSIRDHTGAGIALESHDLGVAEPFEPTCPFTGKACTPSWHLFHRIERDPGDLSAPVDLEAHGLMAFRVKQGFEDQVPDFHAVPTTITGLKAHLRARGTQALNERVRAWLHTVLPEAQLEELRPGLGRVSLAAMRTVAGGRALMDPGTGPRNERFTGAVRDRLERAAKRNQDRAERARRGG
jgi:hypothetical protein